MIECRGLTKRYGDQVVLDGIDLRIEPGERVAVFGLNGAGKTTLLRCMLGLSSFQGEVSIDDRSPHDPEARSRLAYVPQRPPRFDLSVEEFLEVFARLRAQDPGAVRARVESLGLELNRHGAKRLEDLSGGMLQKAVVALALESGAHTLLLDEPAANLDARSRSELIELLGATAGERGVIVSSHRLEDVATLARRAVVLDGGRIAFDGALAELREHADGPRAEESSDPAGTGVFDALRRRSAVSEPALHEVIGGLGEPRVAS